MGEKNKIKNRFQIVKNKYFRMQAGYFLNTINKAKV